MSLELTTIQLAERAAKASPLGSTLKFDLGDGIIFLDGSGDSNIVSNQNDEADCTVGITLDNLKALLSGNLDPIFAFMGGKIKVEGDMSVAMKLGSLV